MSWSKGDLKMQAASQREPVAAVLAGVLRRLFGAERHAAKKLAALIEADPRAARNWLDGTAAPQADTLVRLMAELPEVTEAILALAGRPNGALAGSGETLTGEQKKALAEIIKILGAGCEPS